MTSSYCQCQIYINLTFYKRTSYIYLSLSFFLTYLLERWNIDELKQKMGIENIQRIDYWLNRGIIVEDGLDNELLVETYSLVNTMEQFEKLNKQVNFFMYTGWLKSFRTFV